MTWLIHRIFLLFTLTTILQSCANISAPTGGPRDEKGPEVKTSVPQQKSVNFRGRNIELVFDEEITANNLKDQLLITPLKGAEYDFDIRKNRLSIHFEQELHENTTYTLNFREGIKDITEGNPMKPFCLTFSTGTFIDSLTIRGSVKDLMTNKPMENVTVSLYQEPDTTLVKSEKPLYMTKTTKDGSFRITNIKNGVYSIYALEDKNKSLLYDNEQEKIGFLRNFLLDTLKDPVPMSVMRLDTRPPEILTTRPEKNEYTIQFNEGIKTSKITYENDTARPVIYQISPDAKKITVINTLSITDSIPLNLDVTDSAGNKTSYNINILFDKAIPLDKTKIPDIITKVLPVDRKVIPGKNTFSLFFTFPVRDFDPEKLYFKQDTTILQTESKNITWDQTRTTLNITQEISTKLDSLTLHINEQAFTDYKENTNKEQAIPFTLKKEENYSVLKGTIITSQENYFFQLLNEKYEIIDSLKNPKRFDFNYLTPGSYYLRVLIDENNNGKWDTGNLHQNIQPEPIIFFREKIQLRANWEVNNIKFEF